MKVYFDAEKFLRDGERGLRTRIFAAKLPDPKHTYALVILALRYKPYLELLVKKAQLRASPQLKRLKCSDALLQLLTYDLLFLAKGRIQLGKHPVKDAFLAHKTRLHAELTRLKLKHGVKHARELPTALMDDADESPVRWFRVNPLRTEPERLFEQPEFALLEPVADLAALDRPGLVFHDPHVTNLHGVHPRQNITDTSAYKKGQVIIQDRASCFPAEILFRGGQDRHTCVIDATAAPGNKTTHAAALMGPAPAPDPDHVVYAFERDAKRVQVLKKMCLRACDGLIHPTHADFTSVSPQDFSKVTGLIVDPLCSGSGIFGRAVEDAAAPDASPDRLRKLAAFQFKIVKHALAFPAARKVVYSTCSVHAEENEQVVVDLLKDPEVQAMGWTMAPREHVLPAWERRGWEQEFRALDNPARLAEGCVRAMPKVDGGIGFFAACFVRP